MMMMVVMVPVAPDHDDRPAGISVVMVMVVMGLRQLNIGFGRSGRRAFIDDPQLRGGVRDRLQQVGVGIGLQHVHRLRCRGR